MAIRNPADLKALLPRGRRLLGLDLGTKTIGLALSDPGLMVASPIGTIKRSKFGADATELAKIAREREAGALILGLPLALDGAESPATQRVREFARLLLTRADLFGTEPEIAFWDERFSTSVVERFMIEADMTRKRRAEVVDKMAAAYILQGVLDALSGPRPS
ncbi:MAG: Holliday junction resolvase RuvX [Rhodospirillaceae bacterium]